MPSEARLQPGTRIGDWVIESELGAGSHARVYKARHATRGQTAALKVLELKSASIQQRLRTEAEVLRRLRHQNVLALYELFEVEGAPALAVEFAPGGNLERRIGAGLLPFDVAEGVIRSIASGVAHAHAQGVIHRDLKPENILLAAGPGVPLLTKIADFGLARAMGDEGPRLTRSGATMGSPGYMAPEQHRDVKNADGRSDIFALGAILYRMACGRAPFEGRSVFDTLAATMRGDFPEPRTLRPDLPERFEEAILGALVVDREARTPDAATFMALLSGQVRRKARPKTIAATTMFYGDE